METREVLETAMKAGRLLLGNGAEIFRVEETIYRICRHYGVQSASTFVLSNGIFITAGMRRSPATRRSAICPPGSPGWTGWRRSISSPGKLRRRITAWRR